MKLPRQLSGWETGTICIVDSIRVEPEKGANFDWAEKKLQISTIEAKEKLPAKQAKHEGDTLVYEHEEPVRLPTYDRYSCCLYFDYGGTAIKVGKLGKDRDAFATLCKQLLPPLRPPCAG